MKRTGDDGSTAGRRSTALERSLTQRLDALERANLVRTRRAKLKLELKAGRCSIDMLLQLRRTTSRRPRSWTCCWPCRSTGG